MATPGLYHDSHTAGLQRSTHGMRPSLKSKITESVATLQRGTQITRHGKASQTVKVNYEDKDEMREEAQPSSCLAPTTSGKPTEPTKALLTCQHAHHRQEDLLHALHGAPPLGAALVAHGVVTRRMEDGNEDSAIRVDCRGQNTAGEQ